MVAAVVLAVGLALVLFLALALFAEHPDAAGAALARPVGHDGRARLTLPALRALATELLGAMGLRIVRDDGGMADGTEHLVAVQESPLRTVKHVVVLHAAPPGDLVRAADVLALAEEARADGGATGVLITPYTVEATSASEVEVIDGRRLRALVAEQLPRRALELDRYHFGSDVAREDAAILEARRAAAGAPLTAAPR